MTKEILGGYVIMFGNQFVHIDQSSGGEVWVQKEMRFATIFPSPEHARDYMKVAMRKSQENSDWFVCPVFVYAPEKIL